MTVTNGLLVNAAKALGGEAFDTISHFSVTDDVTVTSIGTSSTILLNEIGTRVTATPTRTSNSLEFNGVRLTTDVVDTVDGDVLTAFGTNTDLAGSTLQTGSTVAGVTHTTAFDLEFIVTLNVNR